MPKLATYLGKKVINPQRTLLLTTRGTGTQMRHLITDFHKLMPHCKKGASTMPICHRVFLTFC